MLITISLAIASLVSLGIIWIGCFYVLSPQRIMGTFGLKPPAPDITTLAWLRLKGIRDISAGVLTLTILLTTNHRTLGTVLIALAIIPLGDMSNILWSGGSKSTAFSVHGLTCTLMLVAGILLIHGV